jgi:hypothetical protein
MRLHTTALLILLLFCIYSPAQERDSTLYVKLYNMPDKLFSRINKKSQDLERKLNTQTEKYLDRLEKQEKKIQKKLWKKDSAAAKAIFGDVTDRYSILQHSLSTSQSMYSGHLDSMQTAVRFLQQQRTATISFEKYQSALNNYA